MSLRLFYIFLSLNTLRKILENFSNLKIFFENLSWQPSEDMQMAVKGKDKIRNH